MTQKGPKKRALNVQLPEDQVAELEDYCRDTGYGKTQVVMAALSQFLAIKREEMDLKEEHPHRRIKSRVVLEAFPPDDDRQRMASVLLY